MLIAASLWTVVAAPVALLLGRCVRLADRAQAEQLTAVPDFVPAGWTQPAGWR